MHVLGKKLICVVFAIFIIACSENSIDNPPSDEEIADALWQQLTTEGYNSTNDEWDHWPGQNGKHAPDTTLIGSDPHIGPTALQTFANATAMADLYMKSFPLKDKSIIVKENYSISGTDTSLAAITVMLKRQGYDKNNNDWFWVKYNPDGSIVISGKVPGCIGCHGGANDFHSDTDYLWTRLP